MSAVKKYFSDIYNSMATVLVGMATTGRTAFRKPVTLEYPDVRWELPERYRGILHNRIEDCIGCLACARACPVNCIHIDIVKRGKEEYGVTSDGTKITQWIPRFDIDMSLCMVCGLCTEPCPTECLTMTKEYELAVHDKHDMYLEFALDRDKVMAEKAEAEKKAAKEKAAREKAEKEAAAKKAAAEAEAAGKEGAEPEKPAADAEADGKPGSEEKKPDAS
ncbi:MAG: 4Fe-4S dicluster domain-containing protein [Candidatus Eisenbacteria bacterium]|nr:4Fe-4S dicluster domain-containing protein [Candidatus Latescibacterota bacterium]MBD3302232.1 4Fe-4S dicluster domain-containing protein [Candidatus Eisenbacteria bacterium]